MAQTLDTIRNYPGMEEGMITTAKAVSFQSWAA